MTLIERARYRLTMLRIALCASAADLRRGFTIRPILGADGADEGDGGDGSGASDDSGTGDDQGGKESGSEAGSEGDGDSSKDEFDRERAEAKIKKQNSEAANLRKRLKDLEPLAKKAKELEDEQKSESEKLTEAKTTAEKEAATAAQEAARLRVALNKGLTEVQAKRLIGDSQEELEADADELLASFQDSSTGKESQEGKKSETHKGGERSGATGETSGEETDPRKLAEGLPSYS